MKQKKQSIDLYTFVVVAYIATYIDEYSFEHQSLKNYIIYKKNYTKYIYKS